MTMTIRPINALSLPELRPLLDESLSEGYTFVQRLWNEYETGVLRFDGTGEALLGVYEGDQLIAIGGLHRDPYLNDTTIGRIRHVYVLNTYRGKSIGRRLLDALIDTAKAHYHTLTLRTPTADATAFYNAIGFENTPQFENATHWLQFQKS